LELQAEHPTISPPHRSTLITNTKSNRVRKMKFTLAILAFVASAIAAPIAAPDAAPEAAAEAAPEPQGKYATYGM
jgi:hypothetical protein